MNQIRKDKIAKTKEPITLEDWSDFITGNPFVVAVLKPVQIRYNEKPVNKRIAFGFVTLLDATLCFDALALGTKKLTDFSRRLNDPLMEQYL